MTTRPSRSIIPGLFGKKRQAHNQKFGRYKISKDKFIKMLPQGRALKNLNAPIRDGDEEKEGIEEYEGCWFYIGKSYRKPKVDRSF
jgi:hypothetical protein